MTGSAALIPFIPLSNARRSFAMEYRLRRHDGEYRWVLDKGSPRFDSLGEFLGYVGSVVDIADQKQADEKGNRNLAHLQRLASLGLLTAAIAHELKGNCADRDQEQCGCFRHPAGSDISPPLAELREIVSDIRADEERAKGIIDRIREFAINKEARMERTSLNTVISDTLLLLAGDAIRRRVRFCTELAPELPMVFGDRTQLQQVLTNLAINGMEAMANASQTSRNLTFQTKEDGGDQASKWR